MPNNYAPGTPVDKFGSPKDGYAPAKIALTAQTRENASASSILLLTHDTTELHVAVVGSINGAFGAGVAGKWLTQATVDSSVAGTSVITAVNTANFDFVVQAGETKKFVVPVATFKQSSGSIQGINRELGLYPAVAFKMLAGSGSVLTMEF